MKTLRLFIGVLLIGWGRSLLRHTQVVPEDSASVALWLTTTAKVDTEYAERWADGYVQAVRNGKGAL